jgi:hypothetical protein
VILDLDKLTDEDYERARRAVEDYLVDMRDRRMSILGRNNGLVIRERNSHDSSIIRMTVEECIRVGVETLAENQAASAPE